VLFAAASRGELIENGNFPDEVKHWHLAVPSAYGRAPEAEVADGSLVVKRLHPSGYIGLHQAVNIRNGKNYLLTFEVRGTPGERYLVMVRDPGKKAHVSRRIKISESWTPVSLEFAGVFDTDQGWVRDWLWSLIPAPGSWREPNPLARNALRP
jgi:hypothetical protein